MKNRVLELLTGALASAVLALVPVSTHAQWSYGESTDARVLSMLPPYCKHSLIYRDFVPGGDSPMEIERWQRLMGEENFVHIHHYCRGLEQTNQALFFERSKQGRDSRLNAALSEFDYVLRNVKADFVMLPEILTRKAQNLLRLDRPELAFPELERALALKADYWPAHAAWSDYYRDAGLPEKAREWLLKGLAAAPGTKALERRLAKLVDTPSKSKAR